MNSSVWVVWEAQGSKETKVDLRFSELLLFCGFFNFLWAKKFIFLTVASALKS
jgi:hypothetical protein